MKCCKIKTLASFSDASVRFRISSLQSSLPHAGVWNHLCFSYPFAPSTSYTSGAPFSPTRQVNRLRGKSSVSFVDLM